MELIGILIIIIGFALKLDTIAVVVTAGVTTGFVANMSIGEILSSLGEGFINNRATCLFMLTIPVIGLCERYGLKAKGLSTGVLLSGYTFIREATIAMGVTLGGHPQFVRPLVSPMAEGASVAKYEELDEKDLDKIKAYSAASDNIGNFFAQNVFIANPGILLIASTLEGLGINVDTLQLSKAAIIIAIIALAIWIIQNILLDRNLKRKYASRKNNIGGTK